MDQESTGAPAGILRRLAALLYDALLTVALLFIATFAVLPLTGGEAVTSATQGPWEHAYRAWLLLVSFGYYGRSWTRGRTLGMAAWRLRLVAADGAPPPWTGALLRFAMGTTALLVVPLVVNYAWMAFDPLRRSLQDRLCGMRMTRG